MLGSSQQDEWSRSGRWRNRESSSNPDEGADQVRLLKLAGAAALVGLIGTGLFNASSATAIVEQTNICIKNEAICQFENLVAGNEGAVIVSSAEAAKPTFVGVLEESCTNSTASSTGRGLNTVEIEKLAFTECKPCKKLAPSLPIKAEGFPTSAGNSELIAPLKMVASECPFGTTCTFSASKAKLEGKGSETAPTIVASAVEIPLLEGSKLLCGSSVKWSSTYKITSSTEKYLYESEGASVTFERPLPLDGFVESKSEE
jgi:hypothetical protein